MLNSVFCSSHCWLSIVPHYTLPFLSFKKRVMFFWFVIYFFLIDSREVYSVCIKVFFFFFHHCSLESKSLVSSVMIEVLYSLVIQKRSCGILLQDTK